MKTPTVTTLPENPFAAASGVRIEALGGPPQHTYGAASMQTYADGQVAYNTHASADGFLAYVNQFEQTSFRVRDSQVEWWQYSPAFDDWMNNYGCDSVEVFYHAGHGGTDSSSGNYSAPLGSSWGGEIFLNSTQMSIGDQRLRYLYLATCEGCMVFPPNNPIRTWNVPNRGIRMLFGATANISDNPDYGTNYWKHWNSGDSFSQAWQDALLDAGSDQQPSSTACGGTADEASSRLFNERFFEAAAVSQNWYWWRWVGNAPAAAASLSLALTVPQVLRFPRVASPTARRQILSALQAHGFDVPLPDGPLEGLRWKSGSERFAVLPGGGVVVERYAASPSRSSLPESEAAEVARNTLAQGGAGLHLMKVLPAWHAGRSREDSGYLSEPEVFEHVIIFRQEIESLPVLTPGVGEVRVHVDGSGKVRRLIDTRLHVLDVLDSGPSAVVLPKPEGGEVKARQLSTVEDVLKALHRESRSLVHRRGSQWEDDNAYLVLESVMFGYALRGTFLVPVARAKIEFGAGRYRMFEDVEVDLIA
jgi:Family of unknown function (DUF6345)